MLSVNKTRPTRGSQCPRCMVIRFFVLAAMLMLVLGLVAGDRLSVLQIVTPARAAAAIWIAGGLLFLVKLGFWLIEKKAIEAGETAVHPGQPEAGENETARR